MLEIGIPVYKARDTLQKLMDSIVAQTSNDFCVCLSIDGDGLDYSDIIAPYIARGIKIRIINSTENGGPGIARQRILDTTECDYLMYVDSDDLLMPRAVEVLYEKCKDEQYDIIRSAFIREQKNKQDQMLPHDVGTITWFHGKVYRVAYLKENNIHFHPTLRADEDAFFNLIAWNCAKKRGELAEVTYIWRYNENSITHAQGSKEYFSDTYMYYITSQVEGLKEMYRIKGEIDSSLISQTLINIYNYYMRARFYKLDEQVMNDCISTLKKCDWIQTYFNDGKNWIEIVKICKAGTVYDDTYVVFFNEPYNLWARRLLKRDEG